MYFLRFRVRQQCVMLIMAGMPLASSRIEAPAADTMVPGSGESANFEMPNPIRVPVGRLLARLARLPKGLAMWLAVGLAALVGGFDLVSGYEFDVTAFYMIPICWACWAGGRRAGLLLASASAVFILAADVQSGHDYRHPAVAYWNALMLLTIFLVAVYSITAALSAYRSLAAAQALLKDSNERLEETVQQRTAALRSEIAERQRVEQGKLQAERLLERKEKLAVLGTLTAGIAHEFATR